MTRTNSCDYRRILVNDIPMMDMRAPTEFSQGAFPSSHSQPLMLDDERAAVGTCYKLQGQDAAIELGNKLVCGETKAARVAQWQAFCQANPNGYLYCFRGGLRSRISQQWLREAGIDYPFIEGGYKAMRSFLLTTLDELAASPLTIIAGYTGSGKTTLINNLSNGIDLEGAAHHRGSSFGSYVSAASTQINFDNILAVEVLKKQDRGYQAFVLEDEGRNVGSVNLPLSLHLAMQQAPLVVIDDPLEVRLERLLEDYVIRMQADFVHTYGDEDGWLKFASYLEKGLFSIRKRLGHARYSDILVLQQQAVIDQQQRGDMTAHLAWLTAILEQYYDPMYDYQLSKKSERIVYRGNYADVQAWLIAHSN